MTDPTPEERAAIKKRSALLQLRADALGLCAAAHDARLSDPARADAASTALHAINAAIRQSDAFLAEPVIYAAGQIGDALLCGDEFMAEGMADLRAARVHVCKLL